MASFYSNASMIQRSKGQNVIATAAYEAREKIKDHQENSLKNYDYAERYKGKNYKNDLFFKDVFLPESAPDEFKNREALWNAVKAKEDESKHFKTAQEARRIILQLPHEYNEQQSIETLQEIGKFLNSYGMIADIVGHRPDKKSKTIIEGKEVEINNVHAHILTTTRDINKNGFQNKNRLWNDREFYHDTIEKGIADIINKRLAPENQISHTPYDKSRQSYKNSKHNGVVLTAINERLNNQLEEIKTKYIVTSNERDKFIDNERIENLKEAVRSKERIIRKGDVKMKIRNSTIKTMIEKMKEANKGEKEFSKAFQGKQLEESEGKIEGLNHYITLSNGLFNKFNNDGSIDIKEFWKYDELLISKVNNKNDEISEKSASYKSGYLYGIEQGKNFIDALHATEYEHIRKMENEKIKEKQQPPKPEKKIRKQTIHNENSNIDFCTEKLKGVNMDLLDRKPHEIATDYLKSLNTERALWEKTITENRPQDQIEYGKGSLEILKPLCKQLNEFFTSGEVFKDYQEEFKKYRDNFYKEKKNLATSAEHAFNDGKLDMVKSLENGFNQAVDSMARYELVKLQNKHQRGNNKNNSW
jgi:hypothetical protein